MTVLRTSEQTLIFIEIKCGSVRELPCGLGKLKSVNVWNFSLCFFFECTSQVQLLEIPVCGLMYRLFGFFCQCLVAPCLNVGVSNVSRSLFTLTDYWETATGVPVCFPKSIFVMRQMRTKKKNRDDALVSSFFYLFL